VTGVQLAPDRRACRLTGAGQAGLSQQAAPPDPVTGEEDAVSSGCAAARPPGQPARGGLQQRRAHHHLRQEPLVHDHVAPSGLRHIEQGVQFGTVLPRWLVAVAVIAKFVQHRACIGSQPDARSRFGSSQRG